MPPSRASAAEPARLTRALVIHPGALGDVLLAIPALRALRADGLAITLAAQPRIGALLVALGVVDAALVFDTLGVDALFSDAALAPDAPIARHLAAASRVVCWFGARDPGFVRRLREVAPEAVVAPATSTTVAVWRHLLATVSMASSKSGSESPPHVDVRLGVPELSSMCAPVAVSAAMREHARRALREAGWDGTSRVVVVHPGAGGLAKRWPVEGFLDVIQGLDATIVVHEGPADADAARAMLARLRVGAVALVDPALPLLAGVIAEATTYLGNDSGVSHLAAAVGTPSVLLFTAGALPWTPWSSAVRCVTVSTGSVVPRDRDAVRAALQASR